MPQAVPHSPVRICVLESQLICTGRAAGWLLVPRYRRVRLPRAPGQRTPEARIDQVFWRARQESDVGMPIQDPGRFWSRVLTNGARLRGRARRTAETDPGGGLLIQRPLPVQTPASQVSNGRPASVGRRIAMSRMPIGRPEELDASTEYHRCTVAPWPDGPRASMGRPTARPRPLAIRASHWRRSVADPASAVRAGRDQVATTP